MGKQHNPNENISLQKKPGASQQEVEMQNYIKVNSFEANCFEAQKMLESIEKKHLNAEVDVDINQ